jgi:hypothetical protein
MTNSEVSCDVPFPLAISERCGLFQALYYPRAYYHHIAFFCANYMTRLFSRDLMIYTFGHHDRWQEYLQSAIERILLRARLDDSVVISAMALLERLRDSPGERPPYPDGVYLEYFVGALMAAYRITAPPRSGLPFGIGVLRCMPTGSDLKRVQSDCVKHLNGDTHIKVDEFLEMKGRMYSFIRTHMAMRSGEIYERGLGAVDAACIPPPCHDEMMKRKALFDHIKLTQPEHL